MSWRDRSKMVRTRGSAASFAGVLLAVSARVTNGWSAAVLEPTACLLMRLNNDADSAIRSDSNPLRVMQDRHSGGFSFGSRCAEPRER